jgi:DNA-directed RNA polymerase specialized sigma24 family protein
MKQQLALTQEAFDSLLAWLDEDRERAATKYEDIRLRLIKVFFRRGCSTAEDLADQTIDRVSRKVNEVSQTYVGEPALYFLGVAQKIFLEHVKKRPAPALASPLHHPEDRERHLVCLENCLQGLDDESRDIVLRYYEDEKRKRIDHRRVLADQLGIAVNALRMRVHRIKATLLPCINDCLSRAETNRLAEM